ncbi:MAG: hypothetical protein LBK97_03220, partial [Prevotellaceae bacterium]|nr:hypothetical protein [Prevotellaceae bacterium]
KTPPPPPWIVILILGILAAAGALFYILSKDNDDKDNDNKDKKKKDTEIVEPGPIAADTITVTISGENVTLSYSGGKGKIFKWYTESCGGTLIGEGNNLKVIPTKTTIYYGRWEDGDKVSDCGRITVVTYLTEKPDVVSVEPSTITGGKSATLSYSGGKGKIFKWYSGSCGGTLIGEGNNLKVSPVKTTTYYGRWEDGDIFSDCQQITVNVEEKVGGGTPRPPIKTKIYPTGKYAGSLKNGIPEGDGKMVYKCRVQIAKHDVNNPDHYAESGDYFDGSWGNGDIVSGYLYNRDGSIKERIIAPKRFNAYDLMKDSCQPK